MRCDPFAARSPRSARKSRPRPTTTARLHSSHELDLLFPPRGATTVAMVHVAVMPGLLRQWQDHPYRHVRRFRRFGSHTMIQSVGITVSARNRSGNRGNPRGSAHIYPRGHGRFRFTMHPDPSVRMRIAVIGSGISGLSAAWMLSQRHDVTIYERADRLGGHSNTVMVSTAAGSMPVDTGFIVYNETNYPNLTAMFKHLGVPTQESDMSFAVSLDDGDLEYSGGSIGGLFAQKRNMLRP